MMRLLIFSLLTISIFSCSKEEKDDTSCTDLKETIVGTWNVQNLTGGSNPVTFNADGTMTDTQGAFLEANGETTNKWEIDSEGRLIVGVADNSDDGYSAKLNPMPATKITCNEIKLSLVIVSIVMTR